MNGRRKTLLRVLLGAADVAVFIAVFVFCDWAAEQIRPPLYQAIFPNRPFQPHPPQMYYMLVPGIPLYVAILAVVGFYIWDWWTPRRLALGAVVMAVLFSVFYAAIILIFQRASYPLLHLALMVVPLAVLSWLIRVLLTALPAFQSYVDRRYPVIRAEGGDSQSDAAGPDTKVSLLTVHYREPQMWEAFQQHLLTELPKTPFELIVANNSPEDELPVRPELRSRTTMIPLKNPGFAEGINTAFEYADGNVLAVFNLDVELNGTVIDRAIARLESNQQAGVILPRLNNPDGGRQHSVRQFYDWRTALYARLPLKSFLPTPRFFREYLMSDLETVEPMSVDWGLGAAMFIRRQSIVGQRIFDPRYFLYFEDVDLCWNMWRRGWQVVYDPDLVCVHRHARASAKGPFKPIFYHHIMSFLLFILKHGGLRRPKDDRRAMSITGSPAD